ncbi:hypothetical protein Y032_0112g322 [Ancylostoma ceylanicum]|uniref:Uncharacterized protein n=2 Tax=Ancylostoma ceylanicum TaxID=53326 RepID=A0A016TDX9_9BILA|nr:hypothetical protein Y032_0112g322 [Ancylostoma ceylanicum]
MYMPYTMTCGGHPMNQHLIIFISPNLVFGVGKKERSYTRTECEPSAELQRKVTVLKIIDKMPEIVLAGNIDSEHFALSMKVMVFQICLLLVSQCNGRTVKKCGENERYDDCGNTKDCETKCGEEEKHDILLRRIKITNYFQWFTFRRDLHELLTSLHNLALSHCIAHIPWQQ